MAVGLAIGLLVGRVEAASPVCSGKIVYSSYETGNAELFLVSDDGTSKTQLTNMAGSNELWPKFSPDGRRVAFMSCTTPGCALLVMNVDGSDAHVIRDLGGYAYLYDWGGTDWLYFAADFDHAAWADDMRRISADGNAEAVLVAGPTGGASERSDGAKVAYVAGRCCWAPDAETRVMDFDGTNSTVILPIDGRSEQWLSYAHHTSQLVLHQSDGPWGFEFPFNIYEVGDDGSGLRRITNAQGSAGFTEPVFAPDDQAIAVMRWLSGKSDPDIVILNRLGDLMMEVAATTAYEQSPDWAVVCEAPQCTFGPTPPQLTFTRSTSRPVKESVTWESCGGLGTLVGRADHVSAARVWLNGVPVVTPDAFRPALAELLIPVELVAGTNRIEVQIEGKPLSTLSLELISRH